MARKRSSTSTAPPTKKAKTNESGKSNLTTSCYFLELPGELRNEIYGHVCAGETGAAILNRRGRGNLSHSSALPRVNRQVRNEFMAFMCMTAPTIKAHVKDFHFGHVITFFNRCDQIDLKTLPNTAHAASTEKRTMTIMLAMTGNTDLFINRLQRWVNRFARPEKKGTQLEIDYAVPPLKEIWARSLGRTADAVSDAIAETTDKTKLQVLEKVAAAFPRT